MDTQIKLAILAIIIVIPLTSAVVWASAQPNILVTNQNEKLVIFTTFFPLYEFSSKVGGTEVDVFLLVPSGVEPHEWEPSIKEIEKIRNADVIVINGLGFEHWIKDIDFTNSEVLIIDSSKNISNEDFIFDFKKEAILENKSELHNPHIWLNPIMAKTQIQNIADGFSQADPSNEKIYQANSAAYKLNLDVLDSKIKNELNNCNADFITYHDAFSYFSKQYGLRQHTIVKSTDHHTEPTPKSLEEIIILAKNLGISVIFSENTSSSKPSQVIANEIGGKVLILSTLEVASNDEDYIDKMENNLINFKEALCT